MKITIKNKIHKTETYVIVKDDFAELTDSQQRRVDKSLCPKYPDRNCACWDESNLKIYSEDVQLDWSWDTYWSGSNQHFFIKLDGKTIQKAEQVIKDSFPVNLMLKDVVQVQILISQGTDTIMIKLKDTTAFPDVQYNTTIKIEAQKGKGIKWCREYLKVEPQIIDI